MYDKLIVNTQDYKFNFDFEGRSYEIIIPLESEPEIVTWVGRYKDIKKTNLLVDDFIIDKLVDTFSDGIVDFEIVKVFLKGITPQLIRLSGE